jgi:outer membrane lipoprotein SlyB
MMAKRAPDVGDTSGGVHCNTPGTSTTQQIACAIGAMSGAMTRGANAAAQSISRIVPAMMAEEPTSVTMAVIRPDGALVMQVADMTQAASMETAMRNAGMESSSVANNVRVMMLQMH